jgi:hypothetical protein
MTTAKQPQSHAQSRIPALLKRDYARNFGLKTQTIDGLTIEPPKRQTELGGIERPMM